ncbi:hypothetical protein [Larsenimonas suaedae]|uniref:DUF4288 domain-containing protein n=1 Tax=Larsenimonas suaedae TaxID=1851019 RepID=A0ABU1H0D9_9GAMM|nr:hypothetical protein [Larsenimonas suaedae]MCM2972899.1 hypothetical protein [Larsenimonas suaedae]MDR5896998.1 hypothetical protein [Larsenimonas suaedae]
MQAELVFNLWAFCDSGTEAIYALSGRAYNIEGTDQEKLDFLKTASRTDYLTAERLNVPDRFKIYVGDEEKAGFTSLNTLNDPNAQLFEEVFKSVEDELPLLPDFSGPEPIAVQQKIPNDPLCVVTTLYEDESGNIRPIITEKDREWVSQ